MPLLFSFLRGRRVIAAVEKQPFGSAGLTGQDLQVGLGHTEGLRQKLDTHPIGRTPHRRRRQFDFEGVPMAPQDHVFRRSGLYIYPECNSKRVFLYK